jgi:hypothetical protein
MISTLEIDRNFMDTMCICDVLFGISITMLRAKRKNHNFACKTLYENIMDQ